MGKRRPFVGDRLLTVGEVAGTMRVSNMTVYRLIKSGQLAAIRVGKNYRIRESDVNRYLADRSVKVDDEGWRMMRILLVAAQKTMVAALVETVSAARLEAVGVDLVPFALLRSVGNVDGGAVLEDSGEEAVVDVGADVTSICVHDRGTPRFVRILPSGRSDMTLAVARALGVSEEEADRVKRGEPVPAGGPNPEDAKRVAAGRTTSFVDEIRSSLEFYAAQSPGSKVGRLTVTGGGSKLEGFMELLSERIAAQVNRGRVFGRVTPQLNLTDEALAEAEPLLAVAVGLALPGDRA